MPTKTTYTIKTSAGPIRAQDYHYTPTGLNVQPLDGSAPVFVLTDDYLGFDIQEVRLPIGYKVQPVNPPAPIETPAPAVLPQNITAPAKKRAVQFVLDRAEGLISECGEKTCNTWEESDSILQQWSRTAPDNGCYDKTDFTVTFEDGETYSGRYDMKRHDMNHVRQLARHIRQYLEFHAGLYCPSHMTRAQYEQYLSEMGAGSKESAQAFLDNYEIPECPPDSAPVVNKARRAESKAPAAQPEPEPPTPSKDKKLSDVLNNLTFKF